MNQNTKESISGKLNNKAFLEVEDFRMPLSQSIIICSVFNTGTVAAEEDRVVSLERVAAAMGADDHGLIEVSYAGDLENSHTEFYLDAFHALSGPQKCQLLAGILNRQEHRKPAVKVEQVQDFNLVRFANNLLAGQFTRKSA